ncbi:hypothetical protein Leryth_004351 [Lithospermum erythrorhizon]|uniref:General transcription factor n=1 Tax=Lithospermum erythrorhizon TaxID=34254 RepID=A0AAV3QAX2_LITER|nr:hypothetical protein Leryth_004351 [Lithospermum erythrorhizon]
MDNIVDTLNAAYQELITAAVSVIEANEVSLGQKTAATNAALEDFKHKWQLFRVSYDKAEEFVDSVKQRIVSDCPIDQFKIDQLLFM